MYRGHTTDPLVQKAILSLFIATLNEPQPSHTHSTSARPPATAPGCPALVPIAFAALQSPLLQVNAASLLLQLSAAPDNWPSPGPMDTKGRPSFCVVPLVPVEYP